jgi:hypothetical protein
MHSSRHRTAVVPGSPFVHTTPHELICNGFGSCGEWALSRQRAGAPSGKGMARGFLGHRGDDTLLRKRGPSSGSNSCAAFAPPSRARERWLYSYAASPLHSGICNRLVLFA